MPGGTAGVPRSEFYVLRSFCVQKPASLAGRTPEPPRSAFLGGARPGTTDSLPQHTRTCAPGAVWRWAVRSNRP